MIIAQIFHLKLELIGHFSFLIAWIKGVLYMNPCTETGL
jgi:hypothetical protein